jgi:hypothetical protein
MTTFRLFCFLVLFPAAAFVSASENTNNSPSTLSVLQKDGKPLARYTYTAVPFKPYIDELRTPSGKNILRDAPHDHLHHHALMYAIRVGGHNFWEEADPNAGKQITAQINVADKRTVESNLDWNVPESKTLVKEVRKISLVPLTENITLLDWQSTLKAVNDTVLGDEGHGHYHGLGVRFVQEMDKDGRFFNSTGKNDGEIVRGDERLTPCRWMAYAAKLEGKPVTVALFDHPSNTIPMTVFTMGDAGGIFAYMSATTHFYHKPMALKAGQTFSVKYRIAVWDGEVSPETVETKYREFVQ